MNFQAFGGIVVAAAIGLAGGVGGYTFVYANGASYLTNDPAACANCHVMRGHHDAWLKSSHRSAAVCNDCHTPPNLLAKYATKAANGFWHSFAFTTGRFSEPLRIKPRNREIADGACRVCHQDITEAIDRLLAPGPARRARSEALTIEQTCSDRSPFCSEEVEAVVARILEAPQSSA